MSKLREAARDQTCVRCGCAVGVVLCHYTGVRRHEYGGGFGIKVNDVVGAHLCPRCHKEMDTDSRNKALRWEHSEEFLHYIALTVMRLIELGVLK